MPTAGSSPAALRAALPGSSKATDLADGIETQLLIAQLYEMLNKSNGLTSELTMYQIWTYGNNVLELSNEIPSLRRANPGMDQMTAHV